MNPRVINPIIKVTENCNFRCDYCHFARNLRKHEHHPHTMELDLLRHILAQCADYNISHGIRDMNICYHGGEPLICGIDYFKKVVEIEKDISKSFQGITITHSLQTNGFLINDDWCDLFEKGQFNVGVSIDGDSSHNHHFGLAGPKKSTDAVLKNIQRLNQKSISHGILFVVSNNHEGYGKDFYDFCIQNKITKIGFFRCLNEENGTTVENKILSSFLIEFFDLYFDGSVKLQVREFDVAIGNILGHGKSVCTMSYRKSCGSYVTFDALGRAYFCDSSYDKADAIGSILQQSLEGIFSSKIYKDHSIRCLEAIDICTKCDVYHICRGGCYRDKVSARELRPSVFCSSYNEIYKHIEKKVTSLTTRSKGQLFAISARNCHPSCQDTSDQATLS